MRRRARSAALEDRFELGSLTGRHRRFQGRAALLRGWPAAPSPWAGDARERLKELIARAEEQGYWHDVLQGRWAAAMLLKNARNDALARREFEDLLELSVRLGDPLLEKDARAWLDRAER